MIVGAGCCLLLTFFVRDYFFFWDFVQLASKHAHHFYDHGLSRPLLPDEMDSGHVPCFGAYLALIWKIFGKSLIVSHVAMLPFLIGIVYQVTLLLRRWLDGYLLAIGVTLVLVDPTLLAQAVLVSPDVPLVFAMFMGINAILDNRAIALSMAMIILMLISMRGVMVAAGIGLWHSYTLLIDGHFLQYDRPFRRFIPYLPGLLLFAFYQYFHYEEKGWIFFHEASPWKAYFVKADAHQMAKNFLALGHRMIDFGRLVIWGILIFIIAKYRQVLLGNGISRRMAVLWLTLLVCLSYSFISYRLTGHRYLLPMYLLSAVLLTTSLPYVKYPVRWAVISIIGLLLGNFIVYPSPISQGWDSSLAHVPYYGLRREMNTYMLQHQLPFDSVICAFPNIESGEIIDLNGLQVHHKSIDECPDCHYLLTGNVYNDFKKNPKIINIIEKSDVLHRVQSNNVFLVLYKLRK